MIFRYLYRRWDDWSLRQMTPERERILLHRWELLSRLGYARLALMFTGVMLLFGVSVTLADRYSLKRYPSTIDAHVMLGLENRFELMTTLTLIFFGVLLSLIFYFGFKMWAIKIASWLLDGRL